MTGCNLEVASLNIGFDLVESPLDLPSLPGRDARVKHDIHLLESAALCLGCRKEHVDESEGIKGTEDHVHLPVDAPKKRRYGEG